MSEYSSIEWTDATWNPTRGCTEVSPGCAHCYAAGVAARFGGPGQPYEGLAYFDAHGKAHWTGRVKAVPEKLADPLRWKEPRRIFVDSMSDLFHEDVPDEFVAAVFGVMAMASRHTFQVLTKRPGRMAAWFDWLRAEYDGPCGQNAVLQCAVGPHVPDRFDDSLEDMLDSEWPLPNVWLGVSVEDQERADERIPHLLRTPAAVRFLSCEPLLGPINLAGHGHWRCTKCGLVGTAADEVGMGRCPCGRELDDADDVGVDGVIVGGESGRRGARPMHQEWVRSIRDKCVAAQVPFFFKQWGEWVPFGHAHGGPHPFSPIVPDYGPEGGPGPHEWANGKPWKYVDSGINPEGPDCATMIKVGKKAAGRTLDGRTWDELPASASAGVAS